MDLTDGLSIPFFSVGRNIHTRTQSLTATLTTRAPFEVPEWLVGIRRVPGTSQVASTVLSQLDVERAPAAEEDALSKKTVDSVALPIVGDKRAAHASSSLGSPVSVPEEVVGDDSKV